MNWTIIGLGYISQRHIQAIQDIGGKLLLACDIDESKKEKVPGVKFYTNYLKMTKDPLFKEVNWVAICTPNYLHFQMAMNMIKMGKNVLCEKPLVIKAEHLKTLNLLPKKNKLYTVLQLRHNPELQELKNSLDSADALQTYTGSLNLNLHRGAFYGQGWKGNKEQSGGLLFNIGVHYFDLLMWFFGEPTNWLVSNQTDRVASGVLTFKNAIIDWSLSIDAPMDNQLKRFTLNGKNIDLSRHFEDLHTKVYKDLQEGNGIIIDEAGIAIKLIEKMSK